MDKQKQWRHPGRQYVPARRKRHTIRWITIGVIALFVVVNAGIWLAFRDRTYPGTTVGGTPIGSVAYGDLLKQVADTKTLPEAVELQYADKKVTVPLTDLGITKDATRTTANADSKKLPLPIANFFTKPSLAAPIKIDQDVLASKAAALGQTFQSDAIDAHLSLEGGQLSVTPAQDKYRLDQERLQQFITTGLDNGSTAIRVPVKTTPAGVPTDDLNKAKSELEKQFATPITLSFGGKSQQLSKKDVISWYVPNGNSYAPSVDAIVTQLNRHTEATGYAKDNYAAATTIQTALKNHKATTVTLASSAPAKIVTYCSAVKGVSATELPTLRQKLVSTYGDSRGWSLDGTVVFRPVNTGCDFTVWLTAANLMPSFGAICDSMWSCRVGPNVVINNDRWQRASPAWNSFGGTIEEYRYMVINHETGHWLGFNHDQCPGAGMQAPVMQQQSIDLQGCSFSPWPNDGEKAELRTTFGL
jgi:hypothetical protein